MGKIKFFLLGILLISFIACNSFNACIAENFRQDDISNATVRLSALHLSSIVSELSHKNADYSFDGPKALIEIKPSSKDKGKGKVTWTLKNIEIDHPKETRIYVDCNGDEGLWQGKLEIIEAKRIIYGFLTGNEKVPVIPDPDQIFIEVKAKAYDLKIRFPKAKAYMTFKTGNLSFKAKPNLAQSQIEPTKGLRIIPTSNISFEDVKLENVLAKLFTDEVRIKTLIKESNYKMRIGIHKNGEENHVSGEITIFGNKRKAPTDSSFLDPEYDREKFIKTYACLLDGDLSFEHIPLEKKLAQGVSGLSGLVTANIAQLYEPNNKCGMSNPEILQNVFISGKIGEFGFATVYSNEKCPLYFDKVLTASNCLGIAYEISGQALVIEASKTLEGLVVQNIEGYQKQNQYYKKLLSDNIDQKMIKNSRPQPVIPINEKPAVLKIKTSFNNLTLEEICTSNGDLSNPFHCQNHKKNPKKIIFHVNNGILDAKIIPIVAKSIDNNDPLFGLCSFTTPIVQIDMSYENLNSKIETSGHRYETLLNGKTSLTTGPMNGKENILQGEILLNSHKIMFKNEKNDHIPLDPDYDPLRFNASFLSCNKVKLVSSHEECSPLPFLSLNVARLLVLQSGMLLKIGSHKNTPKSLRSGEVIFNRKLENDGKKLVLNTRYDEAFDTSLLVQPQDYFFIDDLQNKTFIEGQIESFSASMIRQGERINQPWGLGIFGNLNPLSNRYTEGLFAYMADANEIFVRPNMPDSTDLTMKAKIKNFTVKNIEANMDVPLAHLTIKKGSFKIDATPFMGLDKRKLPSLSYSIETPIVRFNKIIAKDIIATFYSNEMAVNLYIKKAIIKAQNGRFKGAGNTIEADLNIGIMADENQIPQALKMISFSNEPLVPAFGKGYSQEKFDQSYANTRNLKEVLLSD